MITYCLLADPPLQRRSETSPNLNLSFNNCQNEESCHKHTINCQTENRGITRVCMPITTSFTYGGEETHHYSLPGATRIMQQHLEWYGRARMRSDLTPCALAWRRRWRAPGRKSRGQCSLREMHLHAAIRTHGRGDGWTEGGGRGGRVKLKGRKTRRKERSRKKPGVRGVEQAVQARGHCGGNT